MKQDMNGTFRIAFRAMVMAVMTLLTGSAAMAQTSTGPTIHGNVYGGGNLAEVKGHVTVNIKAGTVENDVYGGGALANTNTEANTITGEGDEKVYPTTVNLTGGTIGNAYGGGLGQKNGINGATEDKPAYVYGDVLVNVNGTKFTQIFDTYEEGTGEGATTVQVPKTGRVFGCNNLNGTPKKTVTVHVHKTVRLDGEAHKIGEYEIAAVYGGGNEAPYEPTLSETETADNHAHTNVIIDGCDLTSIKQVYGGGNAASTPATLVTINGAFEINEVFGGGNGNDKIKRTSGTDVSWIDNGGANVGFKAYDADSEDYDTPEEREAMAYGYGKAEVNIGGGIIHYVYGGSNAKGNVRLAAVAMLERTIEDNCFKVDEAYGGGKAAPMDGSAELNLGCIPGVGIVYGGARAATVNNNVVLTITNGTFNKVFGGNNEAGTINGTITLNIEETGCTPIVIGQLYGGGNLAAYTAPTGENGPTLNIKSFTSIGEVYGGGYSADVTGNVHVNINEVVGKQAATVNGYPKDAQNQEDITSLDGVAIPTHTKDAIGAIRVVYGGGYGADVIGDVEVNIGTAETVDYVSMASGETEPSTGIPVEGANITNSVYGGGFGAATTVTGNVVVNVGGQKTEGTLTTFIGGNIAIGGSVYGGSALGAVNATKSGTTLSLTEGKTTAVTLCKGNVTGAVFGGGQGNSNTTAHVYGKSTVTLYGDVVAGGLYGGCDANGEMHDGAELNLFGGTVGTTLGDTDPIPNMVFGGGLGQATRVDGNVTVNVGSKDYTGNTSVTIWGNVYGGGALGDVNTPKNTSDATTYTTLVNLFKGTVNGNVFGGGLGQAAKAASGTEGQPGYEPAVPEIGAAVNGNIRVDLNGYEGINDESAFGSCVVAGSIFGCNNTMGSPGGNAEVHIYKTVGTGSNVRSTEKKNTTYDLAAVFGGGNRAAYSTSGKTAKVFIETCDVSIKEVYGGGYGADVPATNVEVKGAYEIGTVFGGGYGAGSDDPTAADYNPGANVNGITTVLLEGGTIHEAYGGSNTKGDVTGGTNVNVSDNGNTSCPLKVEQIYGGGKNAQMTGGTNIILGCQPDDWIKEIYAGAQAADVGGSVGLTITSGKFERVFGGNKTSGKIKGSITVNIEETGTCATPIIIGELYGGGYQAGYSIYGYNNDNTPRTKAQYDTWYAGLSDEEKAKPENKPYSNPQLNVRSFTSIGAIYGGGYEALMVADPTVSINVVKGSHADDNDLAAGSTQPNSLPYPAHKKGAIGTIGNVFGGGNLATVDGSATVNIGTEEKAYFITEPIHLRTNSSTPMTPVESGDYAGLYEVTVEGANITGNVYGGGKLANITGSTEVNICAKYNSTTAKWESISYATGLAGVTIAGNVYGGGKGEARESGDRAFYCEEAMVGINDTNSETNNDAPDYANYGTHVRIGNGTVGTLDNSGKLVDGTGNVYGGGEIGRVEFHTEVVIGLGTGTEGAPKSPVIHGNVFGAGKGTNTHGYSGLVRGDSKVTVQGDAKIGQSVYGGGEMATVGKYKVVDNLPTTPEFGGKCTVTIQGYAEIGPNDMKMVTESGKPDDSGHVFGAGKGILPYEGVTGTPWSMQNTDQKKTYSDSDEDKAAYLKFIRSLGLASNTDVIIDGNAFVKGSVYGGSENGYVQANTHVTIAGGQVGNGDGVNKPYTTEEWAYDGSDDSHSLKECAHWPFESPYKPYDIYDYQTGTTKPNTASDGHTFYGNVFGGGRGYYPYDEGPELTQEQIKLGYSKGLWLREAGSVGGNTVVDITGGHILTSVYGGNEQTDVTGSCTINMVGGTVGVPRTVEQAKAHPVTCYVFGAGKGDQRINFNTWTNVGSTQVNISGNARIYGSTFGGGEDGHVLGNVETNIGGTVTIGTGSTSTTYDYSNVLIGTTGTSAVDGNIFGGGRGFSETALTAGVVGGNVGVNIYNGTILGTVFGGGRLASVGTFFADATDTDKYGKMQGDLTDLNHGVIRINISGGTIGATASDGKLATSEFTIGDVFGGSKGSTRNDLRFGLAKHTFITMTGGKVKGSVYGGGEVAVVEGDATIAINGGEVGDGVTAKGGAKIGNVFGGGKGNTTVADAGLIKGNTTVTINPGSNGEPKIYHNIYGGGAYGSVGTITYGDATYVPNQTAAVSKMPTAWERAAEGTTQANTGTAEVYVYGGTIGTNGDENGMVFGSSRGDVGAPVDGVDPNNRLAWVYNTKVVIGDEGKSPIIYGSVYGSGENGHVFENTQVDIHNGTIGVTADDSFGGPNYRLRGNVYGGGCGEDTYPGTTGTTKENFNPLAGIVLGTTNVTIDGGQVVHNVYGAGALGSATNTSVTIAGNAIVGVSGKNGGNVFGAARGKEGITIVGSNLANSIETAVNISGGQIWGSVYGGGETGNVKQDVNVSMTGGAVAKDVYGGGALAHTQTANWDMTNATWLADKISTAPNGKTTTTYKTHVSLTGGTITGDAYGGALGRKAVDGIAAVGTEGQDGYTPAVPAITAVEAMVYGDVLVELNGKTTVSNGSTSTTIVGDNAKGCIVNRVFGCNNLNGTPKGKVKVYVYATQKNGESDIVTKAVKNTNTYDVQAVYGGGNLAVYEPVDATLEYNDANKARVDAAYPEVVIDGCKVTSIKQVYGGGNAASVPATFVEIRRCYEIDEVFGGGNGFDNYSVEERGQTVWHQNPGANVGYYDYTHTVTSGTKPGTEANPYYLAVEDTRYAGGADNKAARLAATDIQYGSGIARLEVKGGTIHTSYGGSNSKGNVRAKLSSVYSAMFDDCEMQVAQSYGGGKNAYSDAETDMVADCAKGVKEMFGGAKDADMDGDINMLITNGSSLQRVFGGNNTSGAVNGSITITLEEGGCEPIKIGELYAGGFLAPYSVYGYERNNDGSYATEEVGYIDTDGTIQTRLQRIPKTSGDRLYRDPRINVISATSIGNIFGGGYQAKLVGNPHININMTTGFVKVTKTLKEGTNDQYIYKDVAGNEYAADKVTEVSSDTGDSEAKSYIATTDIGTIGNVYGGGNMADIVGDTYVEIGTGKWVKLVTDSDGKVTEVEESIDRNAAQITGNVFGGGKGKADTFLCEKAMIGKDGDGVNNPDGGTHVTIGNGTVDGNVYGGGEIGRVEKNTVVTIGLADAGSDKSEPVIKGSVFGGGKGEEEHGYAALVRGNPTVIIQADAKVKHNVYGGGEIASVARYNVPKTEAEVERARAQGYDAHLGMPYALANTTSGNCKVTVKDNAIIGPDKPMKMYHPEITDGSDVPDDAGHVFGAGKGVLPKNYTYVDKEHKPKRMVLRDETIHTDAKKGTDWDYVDPNDINNKNVWEYFADRDAYIIFIQTLALSSYANVTIGDDTSKPFVKGSVYGGSENGLVQFDTKVYIKSGQIGCGKNATAPYGDDVWADGYVPTDDLECASWDYGIDTNNDGKKDLFAPYDPNANATGDLDKYPPITGQTEGKSTEGGRRIASDGHTYYGNVFGGGSGSVPYFDTTEGISKYLSSAGTVKGNTYVEISGGHILTNVYGGCEATNVLGKATVKMTDGSIGVPRTPQQIKDHPVTCYLFGAGKGDQRIYFNKETNVNDAIANVEGGRIYGSVFGGGEDGHVLRNTSVTIGKTDGTGPKIGTVGSTYVDGNVFGGGRGFGGEALTSGNVGGSVDLIINGGTMLGSIYGGGRLASVGYGLYQTTDERYRVLRPDNEDDEGHAVDGFRRGHITVTVNGGTIGNEFGADVEGSEHSGNVFGGSMGRLAKIDGSPFDDPNHWALLATAKTTEVNVTGGIIKRNVYGGGEMGTVLEKATVNISGGTIGKSGGDNVEIGNVFGGGKGYLDPAQTYVGAGIVKGNTNVTIKNGASGGTTTTPTIYQNVYGGGELGYVGMFTTPDHKEYTWTENTGLCTVGVAGGTITGHVFGAGKGKDDTFECERAMVRETSVTVSDGKVGGNVYGGGEVGRVDQNSAVTIGSATGDSAPTITGSVFGAGAGVETHGYSALVRGNTAVIVQGNAKVGNSVYGGGQIAAVGRYGLDSSGMPSTLVSGGECVVTVQGNAVIGANGIGNVFGAGMGVDESKKTYTYADNANRPKRMMTYASGLYTDANKALWEFSDATHTYVWEYFDTKTKYLNFLQTLALATDTRLTISGNASVKGSVYGGSESGFVQRYTDVRILGGEIRTIADASGKITEGNVFGGGKGISDNDAAGRVRSDTKVTVLGGTVYGDVYGGGALGKANTLEATNTASVNLLGGVIEGNAFGGGLGNATTAADVGNTRVNLNGMTDEEINGFSDNDFKTRLNTTLNGLKEYSKKGAVVKGNIFGANNVNGTPKGHVLVHVHGTQNETTSALNAKVDGLYDVTGVFGGGNASDYVPDEADTKQSTEVIIEGCDLTSIKEVYGGGYGAAVPATDVLIKGTKIINNVFGGGYGAGTDNPGANVGYVTGGSRSPYALGTGKAVVQLMAGTVNNVYGGSNTKGDIRSGSNVTNVVNDGGPGCCPTLSVQEIYGGGSQADMFGGTEIVLGCMPDDWIGAIYAGAENAKVGNDVSLTLTSGKFGRVFGGNKSGGTIDGYIEVNIEEDPECSTPIIIGGLYGGGNEAPYTVPARYFTNNPNYQSPRVNVRAFTSIGNIYGGGFGASATVTGNPLVNINEVQGGREYAGEDKPLEDGTTVKLYARKADGKMGVIGNVFGGGNAAPVIGNTNVMIGTEAEQEMESLKTTDATTGTVTVVKKPVLGADIQGNVYGAGNNAEVTGHTNVVIGKKAK